ncbi:MAG: NAD-dependent epimerase/dehydratase family protein, partial [Candidatus Bathyarchaeia archaeon]
TYGIPTVALRYFNVYGPRQALGNPYTGVCAIFSSRILNNKPPYIFEDGAQQRDFVHVRDVASANVMALERGSADYQAINIGSGVPTSIKQIAELLTEAYGAEHKPYISQRYRKGDVRHCYADIFKARNLLGYEPTVGLVGGLAELAEWGKAHGWGVVDLFEKALKELEERRLAD